MGPGPRSILAHFAHLTPLHYIDKISEKNSGAPLDQILDPLMSWYRKDCKCTEQISVSVVLCENSSSTQSRWYFNNSVEWKICSQVAHLYRQLKFLWFLKLFGTIFISSKKPQTARTKYILVDLSHHRNLIGLIPWLFQIWQLRVPTEVAEPSGLNTAEWVHNILP